MAFGENISKKRIYNPQENMKKDDGFIYLDGWKFSKEDKWKLVSHLHKSIRHGKADDAAAAAKWIYYVDPAYARYRMAVIAFEDVAGASPEVIIDSMSNGWKKEDIENQGGHVFLQEQARKWASTIKDRTANDWVSCTRWLPEYLEKYNVKRLSPLNLKQTEKGTLDIDSVLEDLKVIEGIEGYVMQFNDGRMIKIKSDWYNAQHRAEAGLRERDVVKMFLDGTLDDVKGALKTDGYDITKLESIESNVLAELNKMETYITEKVELLKGLDMKSAALKINNEMPNNPLNGFVLISLRGKEPDLMTYFERNKLQDYSLAYLELPKLENEKEASVVRSRKMK